MNKSDIKIGQLWVSKLYLSDEVGYYIVRILKVGYEIVETEFTSTKWKDKHWVSNHTMTILNLLENYEPYNE